MVNLKAKPFNLNETQIKWVQETYNSLSEDEKIGQLFVNLTLKRDEEYLSKLVNEYHIGGVRWQGGSLEEVYEQNKYFQEHSKVPVLIAANTEAGGNGAVGEGTFIASGAACGASGTEETVRDMAAVGAEEAKAIGCNWVFAPVCDVVSNWRNTIVNTRAFGDDPKLVASRSIAYMEENMKRGVACAAKHFPGDGSEERDQHLVMGCNDLSVEEWDESFGYVYKSLIDAGLPSVMVGHICQPAYSRKLRPGIKDSEIKPATLSPELLQDLLREQLGFNGLIITDATHMVGLTASMPRKDYIPGVIAAGCDMILFFNDPAEDIQYIRDGLKNGVISQERLEDAVLRILALKAMVGLNDFTFPEKDGLDIVGCAKHHELAAKAADESITLVKDTQKVLPINPDEKKNIYLVFVESAPASLADGVDKAKAKLIEELTQAGFNVTSPKDIYEYEAEQPSKFNKFKVMAHINREEFKANTDLVLFVINMKGYAKENNVRLAYDASHSVQNPWFVNEVPTVAVSLNYTNHLYDVPMMKTFVNAYSDTPEYLHALVEKLTGKSEFKGCANELVWCGRWETRL
ncbi:beta-N-acetylhexosaminidase [Pseudobutyrivibrio sp. ACV-2]|uniref:glycoside hydrolase family 3 protein n=1 Tax=Pseudobutyrivibrio sp. ACV-2 TaxID=1520801 RepID=UPI00089A3762|nr:glycoside hydrolase family 3 N-terminal domain-containing protein [Pseudobutyrivibrio sp. ACV-2]SEA94986.1 beta-N-acetylhexosaminidase [Pseudobutyrivibrio sp. ACV-2]